MSWFVPDNFILEEFFPEAYFKEIYPVYGKRMWTILDDRIKKSLHLVRELHGPMIMNTWHSSYMIGKYGYFESRGYRPHDDDDVQTQYSPNYGNISQHRFGRAVDAVPVRRPASEIRAHMRKNPDHPAYSLITRVENTIKGKQISWLHMDCADTGEEGIVFLDL